MIRLPENTLIKFSLGPGGPPIPVQPLIHLLENQTRSLKALHLGHIVNRLSGTGTVLGDGMEELGNILEKCEGMEDFRFEAEPQGSLDAVCDQTMSRYADAVYSRALRAPWRQSLKHLALRVPQAIDQECFYRHETSDSIESRPPPALERLELTSANIPDPTAFAHGLAKYVNLRSMDLSGTTITDQDIFIILDGCLLLSSIDLTSCRGVNVRNRRNIFKAWEEGRKA